MGKKYTSIKIRNSTKERLDILCDYLGHNIIDVIDRALTYYQIAILRTNLELMEKGEPLMGAVQSE